MCIKMLFFWADLYDFGPKILNIEVDAIKSAIFLN